MQNCFELDVAFLLDFGVHGKHPVPRGKESLWLVSDSQSSSSDNVKCFDELLKKSAVSWDDDLTDFLFRIIIGVCPSSTSNSISSSSSDKSQEFSRSLQTESSRIGVLWW